MPSKVFSSAIVGLDGQIIEVETEVSYGLRYFTIVGLPDKAVEESKERIGAAIKSSGFKSPHSQPQRVLVNLAPADLKKEGSFYDLPIALGYLVASRQIQFDSSNKVFIGELALDGKLRATRGALSFVLAAKEKGFKEVILPRINAPEAALVEGLKIIGAESLKQVIGYLKGEIQISPFKIDRNQFFKVKTYPVELSWIKGQEYAKRALEVIAAGGHNLLMLGPPGTGKTLLAKAIPSILPGLNFEESLEVTKIYSVAGLLQKRKPLLQSRPFRAPHHSSSKTALIGGGNPPRLGEITLAHRGVLFLDEFPEFHRDVLESLRQPMEEGRITIARARYNWTLPTRFTLIAASNPCPCGHLNDPEIPCTCSGSQIAKYRRKLTGPLIDRIDVLVEVPRVRYKRLVGQEDSDKSNLEVKEKIKKARTLQEKRFKESKILLNSEMNVPLIKKYCQIDSKSHNLLQRYVDSGKLSTRGYHRVLKIARTIADLDNQENISYSNIAEALIYRLKEVFE